MLTEKEKLILSHLRTNSRKSLVQMSMESNTPVTTLHDTLGRLSKKNIIHKHTSLLDFSKLGYPIRVNVALKSERKSEMLEFLLKSVNVNSISKINNGFDYHVDALFTGLSQYESFKETLQSFGLSKISEHYVVEEIKREGAKIEV
jgi:DNA-binding Lrp family transcriptional regulator